MNRKNGFYVSKIRDKNNEKYRSIIRSHGAGISVNWHGTGFKNVFDSGFRLTWSARSSESAGFRVNDTFRSLLSQLAENAGGQAGNGALFAAHRVRGFSAVVAFLFTVQSGACAEDRTYHESIPGRCLPGHIAVRLPRFHTHQGLIVNRFAGS